MTGAAPKFEKRMAANFAPSGQACERGARRGGNFDRSEIQQTVERGGNRHVCPVPSRYAQ